MSIVAILFYNLPFIFALENLLRVYDAFFVYFVFSSFLKSLRDRLIIFKIIWISTLLISIFSIYIYSTGRYNIDVTQNVIRYAGVYNDPGMPSYLAVISIVFGSLFIEINKKINNGRDIVNLIIFIITILVSIFILAITITKSALLMLIIYLLMWPGLYKRKLLLLVPLMLIIGSFVYNSSAALQRRMQNEIRFFKDGEFTIESARSMGTGRVAKWEEVMDHFHKRYNLFNKLFGTYHYFGSHNQYIEYLVRIGIIGLIIFLGIVIGFFKQLLSLYHAHKSPELFMAIVVLTIFFIYGISGHPFDYTTLLWYLMILLSLVNVKIYPLLQNGPKKSPN
jgi:O-antigen ligase